MKPSPALAACLTVLAGIAFVLPATAAQAAPTRYEAESAPATCDGTIDSNHAGFSGTGFCNGSNAVGAAAQFTVIASSAGTATVGVRFANGTTAARPAEVIVNGARATTASFDGTGAWTTWGTSTVTVTVAAGSNTIRLSPTTAAGLANIDYLEFEQGSDTGTPGNGRPNDANLQYYGRWNRSDPSFYAMGWAGGYVDARFTGSSIGVRQRGAVDLFYSVDGRPPQWRRNVSGNVTLATGLTGASHSVRIGYRERDGAYNGDPVFGGLILASGGQTFPFARPQNLVEFIGDSITVGSVNANRPFVSFPWRTGETLGAAHTQIAQSGACLVGQRGCLAMMDGFRGSSRTATSDDWDFSTYQATAVVIGLGTNDFGRGVTTTQFQQNYIVMLERIRKAYPDAHVFAMGTFQNLTLYIPRRATRSRPAMRPETARSISWTPRVGSTRGTCTTALTPPRPAT